MTEAAVREALREVIDLHRQFRVVDGIQQGIERVTSNVKPKIDDSARPVVCRLVVCVLPVASN